MSKFIVMHTNDDCVQFGSDVLADAEEFVRTQYGKGSESGETYDLTIYVAYQQHTGRIDHRVKHLMKDTK